MPPLGGGISTDEKADGKGEVSPSTENKDKPNVMSSPQDEEANDSGPDDETSDQSGVVVSPNASLGSGEDHEIFQDAREPNVVEVSLPTFVQLGLMKKASPFSLRSWTGVALTLDGRDKITKVFQYVARLLAWWFAGPGRNKSLAFRFSSLYKSLSNSRKAFRLGRSLIEIQKLHNVGLRELIRSYLQRSLGYDGSADNTTLISSKEEPRKIPSSSVDGADAENDSSSSSVTSMSLRAYRTIFNPLRINLSKFLEYPSPMKSRTTPEILITIGSALKMLGLLGFWTADNINYVYSTGFLDDHSLSESKRLARRNNLQALSGIRANQSYFAGAVAGLFANTYAYVTFRRTKLAVAEKELQEASDAKDDDQRTEDCLKRLASIKEKQFSLLLALLKSCCDVVVFSNNPGIDLHQKYRGRRNHEGLHCLCGLLSAATVLYNNFPDTASAQK